MYMYIDVIIKDHYKVILSEHELIEALLNKQLFGIRRLMDLNET